MTIYEKENGRGYCEVTRTFVPPDLKEISTSLAWRFSKLTSKIWVSADSLAELNHRVNFLSPT